MFSKVILRKNTILTGILVFFVVDCILRMKIRHEVMSARQRKVSIYSDMHENEDSSFHKPEVKTANTKQAQTSSVGTYQDAEERFKQTQLRLFDACNSLRESRKEISSGHMRAMVNPSKSIVYCLVNKAASTFIKSSSMTVFNCSYKSFLSSSQYFNSHESSIRTAVLNRAFKFMFVREPYGRLFSTYSNKFYFPKDHWAPIGPEIVKTYRINPSRDSLLYGHNITFTELIRYTVDQFESGKRLDKHLRPMNVMCSPCDYHFNFIGKLETMSSDWKLLLDKLRSKGLIEPPPPAVTAKDNTIFFILKHILLTRKIIQDSKIPLYNLYLRAWTYYQITGVLSKKYAMPYTSTDDIDHVMFTEHLKRAIDKSEAEITEVKRQRQEALIQAYSTVPMELLERLRKVVYDDCLLFGYDERPDWLFNRTVTGNNTPEFDYFKGINM